MVGLKEEIKNIKDLFKYDASMEEEMTNKIQNKSIYKNLLEIDFEKNYRKKRQRKLYELFKQKNARNEKTQIDPGSSITAYNLISSYCNVNGHIGQTKKIQ